MTKSGLAEQSIVELGAALRSGKLRASDIAEDAIAAQEALEVGVVELDLVVLVDVEVVEPEEEGRVGVGACEVLVDDLEAEASGPL